MFLLIKLPFLMLMLPFKILAELIEHSGHRRHHKRHRSHYRSRVQHQPRPRRNIAWLPGQAGLTRWTRQVAQSASQPGRTPVQRYLLIPAAMLAVGGAWLGLVYVWIMWWVLMVFVLMVDLAA